MSNKREIILLDKIFSCMDYYTFCDDCDRKIGEGEDYRITKTGFNVCSICITDSEKINYKLEVKNE